MSAIGLGMLAAATILGRLGGNEEAHERQALQLLSSAQHLRLLANRARDDATKCFMSETMIRILERADQELSWLRDQRAHRREFNRLKNVQRELRMYCERTQVEM